MSGLIVEGANVTPSTGKQYSGRVAKFRAMGAKSRVEFVLVLAPEGVAGHVTDRLTGLGKNRTESGRLKLPPTPHHSSYWPLRK